MSLRTIILGPYTGSILEVAGNIRRGFDLAAEAARAGLYVLPCWWDWQLATRTALPIEYFKANTISWMECADVILLAPGWEHSEGVKAELQRAAARNLPAFDSVGHILHWRDNFDTEGIGVLQIEGDPVRVKFPGREDFLRT